MARIAQEINNQLEQININELNTKETLLVVVDMIKGFVESGNMADAKIKDIIPSQVMLTKKLDQCDHLYFVDSHLDTCQEFKCFPEHCKKDTVESEIADELKADSEESKIIYKNSTNGFLAPNFLNHLDTQLNYKNFVIIGCCTDICVMQFALTLQTYIHQYDLDSKVIVVMDGVDTYHIPEVHDAFEYNKMAYQLMKASGIKFVRM